MSVVKRTKITPANLLNILTVLINIGGGDVNAVNLSYSYIQSNINRVADEISSTIIDTWNSPDHLLLPWDDKITPTLDGTGKEKRMPEQDRKQVLHLRGKCRVRQ